jgi:hypothetical protein
VAAPARADADRGGYDRWTKYYADRFEEVITVQRQRAEQDERQATELRFLRGET